MFEIFCAIAGITWSGGGIVLILLLAYAKNRDWYSYLFAAFWPLVAFGMLCTFIFADLNEVEDDEGNII